MVWALPLPMHFIVSDDSMSFRWMDKLSEPTTAMPLLPHPAAHAFVRKFQCHEGVDFYCPPMTSVQAVEDGGVVGIENFTGKKAGSPWWHDTYAVLVEGKTGVVVYGEIDCPDLQIGDMVKARQEIGRVIPVLKKDKGRPITMLHLELHVPGTRLTEAWEVRNGIVLPKPTTLLDPTPYLLEAVAYEHAKRPMQIHQIDFDALRAQLKS